MSAEGQQAAGRSRRSESCRVLSTGRQPGSQNTPAWTRTLIHLLPGSARRLECPTRYVTPRLCASSSSSRSAASASCSSPTAGGGQAQANRAHAACLGVRAAQRSMPSRTHTQPTCRHLAAGHHARHEQLAPRLGGGDVASSRPHRHRHGHRRRHQILAVHADGKHRRAIQVAHICKSSSAVMSLFHP